MGQDLSNLSNLLGREAEDDRPIETSQLLVSPTSPALPSKPSSRSGLQILSSSSPNCFYSCSHSNVISQPTVASHQNLLISRKSGSESHTDSCTGGAWQQDILISSSSSEPLSSHNSSSEGARQRDLLIPWPWPEYLFSDSSTDGSLNPAVAANLSIDFLEEKKQVVPFLSQAHALKHPGDREEEKVSKPVVTKEIWMKYYSSFQKILLVGEGDFSFSACLAVAFGSATNMIATSLDSRGYLSVNYWSAMSNIGSLSSRGAKVMHGVDATEMASHSSFEGMTFDRIVFNFPHDGFFQNESRESQLRRHRKLVRLFMANAKKMITDKGEIHVSHKSNGFFREWKLQELASNEGLLLIEEVHFNFTDYPGYNTKYGFGGDKNFDCNPSKTYKFGLKGCRLQLSSHINWE